MTADATRPCSSSCYLRSSYATRHCKSQTCPCVLRRYYCPLWWRPARGHSGRVAPKKARAWLLCFIVIFTTNSQHSTPTAEHRELRRSLSYSTHEPPYPYHHPKESPCPKRLHYLTYNRCYTHVPIVGLQHGITTRRDSPVSR